MTAINEHSTPASTLLEGLLVKKAGLIDAVGLVEGVYPGAGAAGFRDFPESDDVAAPRIGEVYTQGTLTLARLGREAPIAAASPSGPALRDAESGSLAARSSTRTAPDAPEKLPRSPVIGTDSPEQYEQREDIGQPRKRLPASVPRKEPACRPRRHSSTSVRPASTARSRRCSGSARRRGSSPAATACCR